VKAQLTERERKRALRWVQCEACDYDLATGFGERGCHYGECPYLPDALDVVCPTCRYNFAVEDGNPECGDPPRCEFAAVTVKPRLAMLDEWKAFYGR
jgi:hypothetical protein